jgi:hypothetical protein
MKTEQRHQAIRSLLQAPSRRDVLAGLAMAGLGFGIAERPRLAVAKRKRRPKKGKPNAFGCLGVGQPCKNARKCCSGICKGKKGKRRCVAHGTGTCDQDGPGYCAVGGIALCNGSPTCICAESTAGSYFCGDAAPPSDCAACKKDVDCEALGFPPGSACVPWTYGGCAGLCEQGTACLAPC